VSLLGESATALGLMTEQLAVRTMAANAGRSVAMEATFSVIVHGPMEVPIATMTMGPYAGANAANVVTTMMGLISMACALQLLNR